MKMLSDKGFMLPFSMSLLFLQMVHSGVIPGALFSFEKAKLAYEQVQNGSSGLSNKSPSAYEVLAAAAGYEALRMYETHRAKQGGHAPSPATMQDLLAEFSSKAVDKLFETNKVDYLDKKRTRSLATANAIKLADEKYAADAPRP